MFLVRSDIAVRLVLLVSVWSVCIASPSCAQPQGVVANIRSAPAREASVSSTTTAPFRAPAAAVLAAEDVSPMIDVDPDPPADPTKPQFTALPGVFYGPETSVGFGASAGAFFDIQRPPAPATSGARLWSRSWILAAGAYTMNRQAVVAVFPYLVFREGRVVVDGEFDLRRFPNRHFGFGREGGPDFQVYTKEAVSFATSVLMQAIPRLYVGPSFSIGASRFVDASAAPVGGDDNVWLGEGRVSGEQFARPVGAGVRAYYDGRDHARMTRRGHYNEIQQQSFLRAFGSSHDFYTLTFDARGYVPIARNASFAAQLQSSHTFGDVPFERLAFVGGPRGMRAFRLGRYVDRHHTFARAEVRFPIVWRFRGAVGSELGIVYGPGSRGEPATAIWDVVLGVRFVIREQDRLLARADIAYGTNGFAGLLYLNEAF